MTRYGLLTEKQLLVLALAACGKSVAEIARMLGVTRQDVSTALRRARRNMERAAKTMEAYVAATSPFIVHAAAGTALLDLADELLRRADRAGRRIPLGRAELVIYLRAVLAPRLAEGRLREEACLALDTESRPVPIDCSIADAVSAVAHVALEGVRGG